MSLVGTLTARRHRRANGMKYRVDFKPTFVDAYPWIPKTGPESLIFNELAQRHIHFYFQIPIYDLEPSTRGAPVLGMKPYRADFAIPGVKVIIDPWDDYHHSDPQQAQDDAYKLAVYESLGWHTYYFWASDIAEHGPAWALAQIPELGSAPKGGFVIVDPHNDSAAIATANRRRAKPPQLTIRRRVSRGRRT